ncbi:hypothetical protein [Streptomyces sp. NPDC088727]|uniref:hypothetical protein n=1 Tax=Streptomyces sp. NPDC088727 TaxID=3365875 RepID=UPI0037F4305C
MTDSTDDPQYPLVKVRYTVQYQERRHPDVWWDTPADSTGDLAKAQEFSRRLLTGADKPRGNPKVFVAKTRIAQTVSTTTIIEGEGSPAAEKEG